MAIRKKFIGANQVDGERLLLDNNEAVRSKDSGGSSVELMKLDATDVLKMLKLPRVDASLPSPGNAKDLTTKEYVDSQISSTGGNVSALESRVTAIEDDYGVAGGLATLDGSGKVPVAQLPSAIMTYVGVWDASTNTPALANGAGNADEDVGDVYRVSVAGSHDFGAGAISFEVGDYVILNSSKVFEKSDTTDSVASVNGFQGVVVLETDDVAEAGGTNLYYTPARQSAIEAYADQAEADAIASANSYTDSEVAAEASARSTEDLTFLKLDGSRALTGPMDAGGQLITMLGDPSAQQDAATKNYVDNEVSTLVSEDETFLKLDGTRQMTGLLDMGSNLISQVSDPVDPQDAATKAYVDAGVSAEESARIAGDAATLASAQSYADQAELDAIASAESYTDAEILSLDTALQAQLDTLVIQQQQYQSVTLSAGDISNGYIDVSHTIVGTPWVMIDGVMGRPGSDFTVSGARITWAGDFAVGGQSALEASDVVHVFYMRNFSPFV